jgi:thiamine biosynthesis lipoprotein
MAVRHSNFQAIGTSWNIETRDSLGDKSWAKIMHQIQSHIEDFDKAYSRFRADSLVTKMSRKAGRYKLPPDAHKMLRFYEKLYRATEGKITPLIGQTMSDAGYDANYSLRPKKLAVPAGWENVIEYDQAGLNLKQAALLDFGAAGKGYLIDIIAGLLAGAGLKSFTINAGGDILHRSSQDESLAVGMENPIDTSEAVGIIKLQNQSLCASAGSKRKWAGYHHIIDPESLESPRNILAVWVIAGDTMTADGLATALFFTNPGELAEHFKFSYALLYADMSLQRSKAFPAKLFEAQHAGN